MLWRINVRCKICDRHTEWSTDVLDDGIIFSALTSMLLSPCSWLSISLLYYNVLDIDEATWAERTLLHANTDATYWQGCHPALIDSLIFGFVKDRCDFDSSIIILLFSCASVCLLFCLTTKKSLIYTLLLLLYYIIHIMSIITHYNDDSSLVNYVEAF